MSDAVPGGDGTDFPREALLRKVAAEDIDSIPDGLPDQGRFLVSSVRAAMRRTPAPALSVFVHSPAAHGEGKPLGFERVFHMQDGNADIDGQIILTNRDAHNGASRALTARTIDAVMTDLESLGLADRWTLVWDGPHNAATFYPEGTAGDAVNLRYVIHRSAGTLTQDEVCEALNAAYNENLKTPSAHTVKLWEAGKLLERAEDRIERHLKGELTLFFVGRSKNVKVLAQTPAPSGRTDLMLLQRLNTSGGPEIIGVLELKVLHGTPANDRAATEEGLSQGYHYREDFGLPFATLALYDVAAKPSHEVGTLLEGQNPAHIEKVRTRRFPIYQSAGAWRDAGGYKAA